MDSTFSQELAGKTRIIVTHALHFLRYADQVIFVDQGSIKFKGTYNQLKNEDFFNEMIKEKEQEEEKEEAKTEETKPKPEKKEKKVFQNEVRKLEGEEVKENPLLRMFKSQDKQKGALSGKTLSLFIKSTGGYFTYFIFFLLAMGGGFFQIYAIKMNLSWAHHFDRSKEWTEFGYYSIVIY